MKMPIKYGLIFAAILIASEANGTFLVIDGHRKIRTCNQSYVNSNDQAPGLVNFRSVHGQCIENRTNFMKIVWNDPVGVDKLDHYLVYIKPRFDHDIYLECFETSNTETYFYYEEKHGFVKSTEYLVRIETYPRLKENKAEIKGIGGCPLSGIWSKWGDWGHCSCTETCKADTEICTGRKSRTRVCKYNNNAEETYSHNCPQHQNDEEDSRNCVRKCKEELVGTGKDEKPSFTQTLFIVVGCFVFLFGILLALYFGRRSYQKKRNVPLAELTEEMIPTAYISYLVDEHKETSLLKLISCLRHYGIHCIIDLLCTVEINASGGLPNWLPGKISAADKIIVILSQDYIKALNSVDLDAEDVPDKVCKIHTEFKLINTMLYHTCQKTPKIILVLKEGVKSDGIPHVFRGMHHCVYPKKMDSSDEDLFKLLGVLLDTEPIQIA